MNPRHYSVTNEWILIAFNSKTNIKTRQCVVKVCPKTKLLISKRTIGTVNYLVLDYDNTTATAFKKASLPNFIRLVAKPEMYVTDILLITK